MPVDPNFRFEVIVSSILKIFDTALPVLVALALVLFMIGVVKYIYSEGEHKNRGLIVWSLIALFVLVSVWGILRVLLSSLPGTQEHTIYENSGNPY